MACPTHIKIFEVKGYLGVHGVYNMYAGDGPAQINTPQVKLSANMAA